MSTGEDELSPCLNGRLRPRRSTSTTAPSPRNKPTRKPEGKPSQDRPKRTSISSNSAKQDDLVTKSDAVPVPLFLCPYCDRKFNARQTASKHARRIHLSTSKQDSFIKCLYCSHSDAESNAVIKHMVDSHPNQYFACLDCHTRFPSTTDLAEHKHNVCEKQKPTYRSKLRQKTSPGVKKNTAKSNKKEKTKNPEGSTQVTDNFCFSGIVISCELKPSMHDAADIEDKITTNLILPSSKAIGNAAVEKNAVIVLDDLQWNKRIPPNFSFHNSDADQILSRLGVVHRSPRVGESRKDLIRMMDEPNEKFEKCFDTIFYSKVAKNVQENLAKFLDGTFNFNPNRDNTIKTRKSKASVMINTAEGFPILLAHEQFSRGLFDGFIPRAVAPKHKWKWDTAENDKNNLLLLLDQTKRDSHVNNCIITLISSLDIWTQLRMKSKFVEIFKSTPTAKKIEKQNIIGMELKEILESRDIPSNSTYVTQGKKKPMEDGAGSELCSYLGLYAKNAECELQPAVLSGEWVRPRCYVCCACGDQTRDARTLSAHLATRHPNAQVQHYEIVGETLLSADILKHLYVPPSQMSNRTRPPRGFRDCTKCKKSITLEDLHQHMLDCAGDTPAVRRKCRYRPFGVRRRRQRLPDNTIRKKMRKDHQRSRHRQKSQMRPRPRIRTEVGDAETIRKMLADLPAKRNRNTPANVLRPRRPVLRTTKQINKLRSSEDKKSKHRPVKNVNKPKKVKATKKQIDTDNSSTIDEDDQPLKLSAMRVMTRKCNNNEALLRRATLNKINKKKQSHDTNMARVSLNQIDKTRPVEVISELPDYKMLNHSGLGPIPSQSKISWIDELQPAYLRTIAYPPYPLQDFPNQRDLEQIHNHSAIGELYQENVNAEVTFQVPHIQSALESLHQRIDVKSAGPSNVRRHASHDDNNMHSNRDRFVGKGDSSNQSNNLAQAPSVPLKHSIASLTSDTDIRDASMPYHRSYLTPPETNVTFVHKSGNGRNVFENEATVEKVDKPPSSNNSTQFKKSNEQRSVIDYPIACDLIAITPPPFDLIGSQNPIVTAALPNKPTESRAASVQMLLQKNSSGLHGCDQPTAYFEESQKLVTESLVFKNAKELVGLNLVHKTAHSNTEMKVDTDKNKSSKIRKGLNDCIAMLQTKKGFRLDKTTSGHVESVDSEMIDLETVDSEKSTTIELDSSLSASKTTEEKAKKRKNTTPTHSFFGQDKDFSLSRNRRLSTDQKPAHTSNTYTVQQNKLSVKVEQALQNLNQHENKFSLTKPSNRSGSGKNQLHRVENTQAESLKYSGEVNPDLSKPNVWRNSQGEISPPEELERYFYRTRVNQTIKTLIDFNKPSLTHSFVKAQVKLIEDKKGEIDTNLLPEYNHHMAVEMHERQNIPEIVLMTDKAEQEVPVSSQADVINVESVATTVRAFATAAPAVPQIAPITEDIIDVQIVSRQTCNSPTSRRTRRKPTKNKAAFEQQLDFDNDQNIQQEHAVVSPPYHDSREIIASPIDSNMEQANSRYLSAVSPSFEMLALKTPTPPAPTPNLIHARRESSKRVLNNSETNTTITEIRDNISLPKLVVVSPETQTENIMNMRNIRRPSIEVANAQNITALNDNFMTPVYRASYGKAFINISQTSRAPHVRKKSPDSSINDNMRFDNANEMHGLYSSSSAFVSMNQDTHGIMHVIPKMLNAHINKSNTRETHDRYKIINGNDQYTTANKQISNTEAKRDYPTKLGEHVDEYSSLENKAHKAMPAVLPKDINSTSKTPETYYTRSSSYQSNVSNTKSHHSLDMGYNENKETHDKALRAYHEPGRLAPPFAATAAYSNNMMHIKHNTISLMPSSESVMEEMAPLDLSCESKSRKEQTINFRKSDVSKDTCTVSISKETNADVLINPNYLHNYGEILQNPLQRSLLTVASDSIEEPAHKPSFKMPLQNYGRNKNQEISTPKLTYQSPLTTAIAQSANITKTEILDRSKNINNDKVVTNKIKTTDNTSNHITDELRCLPPEGNYYMPQVSQILRPKTIYQGESEEENILFENKETTHAAMQVNLEAKFENETSKKTSYPPINMAGHNVENINPLGAYLHTSHCLTSSSISTASENDLNINPVETNASIKNHEEVEVVPDNDNMQIEQDAETARKIAMLPEELVKILGTIPKDHRNQLLNVLPQYVSTTVSNVESDKKNTLLSPRSKKNTELQADKQNTSTSCDSNRLSVSNAISLSSVIPKKRLSPLHSKGILNSSDSQSGGPIITPTFPLTLSQCSPIGYNESSSNAKCVQTDCSTITSISESRVLDPTHNTSEKDSTDKIINDLSEPAHLNKTNEAAVSIETDNFPTTSRDFTLKIPTKQRPSSEQTASLRAVRIKTTSSKKCFSDDKQSLPNYCYPTNVAINEISTNLEHIVNAEHQTLNINPTDLKYENIKQKHDTDVILRDTNRQNTSIQENSNNIESVIIDNTKEGNSNITHNVPQPHYLGVSQNESQITLDDASDGRSQSNNTIALKQPSSLRLQDFNTTVDNFAEQIKPTTFLTSTVPQDNVSAEKPNIISSDCDLQLESVDIISNIKSKMLEETKKTTEYKTIQRNSDDNIKLQPLSSPITKNNDVEQDKAFEDKEPNETFASSSKSEIKNAYEPSMKYDKSNEDDSEDDVTLAVIKQNHYKSDSKKRKSKEVIISAKLKSENSGKNKTNGDNQVKTRSKRHKNKSKTQYSTKNIRHDNVADAVTTKNELISQLKFNDVHDDKIININTLPITTTANIANEFYVNKEYAISKNMNNTENNNDRRIPKPNEIESSLDDSGIKKKQIESSNTNAERMDNNFRSDKINDLDTKSTDDLAELNVLSTVEFDKTVLSIKEGQLKVKQTNSNKTEIEFSLSDVDCENELNLLNPVMNCAKHDNRKIKDSTDVSEKESVKIISALALTDNIPNDFQLCSEISEVIKMPLRRSRRGKSLYVDSTCLEESEQIEDRTKKTPLTMKRLILSRVEKDKERDSETGILEKKDKDATNDLIALTSERPETPCVKKGKLTKRKKSPHSKRISKKTKRTPTSEHDEDCSDFSNLHNTAENNSCILRELPNAENKITEKDSGNDDLKLRAVSENTLNLSENTTIVNNEKESDVSGEILIETKESTTAVKRKLNTTKPSDIRLSKPKKSKYHKKKSQSDFDSDDDKALLETKHKIATETQSTCDYDCSNESKEENKLISPKSQPTTSQNIISMTSNDTFKQTSNINIPSETRVTSCSSDISKEDNETPPKSQPATSKDILLNTCNEIFTQIANVSSETRVTCYSKSISNRRPRSSSTSLKDHSNYDPYDIDFIDILETARPIVKKKGKSASNSQSMKLHQYDKRHKRASVPREDINKPSLDESKQTIIKMQPNTNAESDSDSSKSDVPLQKYVDEKVSKMDLKNRHNESLDIEETEKIEGTSYQKCLAIKQTFPGNTNLNNNEETCSDNLSEEASFTPGKSNETTKRATTAGESVCENKPIKASNQNTNNNISKDQTTQKQPYKQKKARHTPAVHNVDSANVTSKEEEKLKSDKFMENFGFYSERIPRKSNLLASKKISETFHMICNDSDDSFLGYKEKSSRKSSSNESKKKSETMSNLPAEAGTGILQDTGTMTGDVTNYDVQTTEPKTDIYPIEPGDVMNIDDSDLDFLAAQAILDSEEVRSLENDLFSSLREAAEAGASRHFFVGYQNTSNIDTTAKDVDQKEISQLQEKVIENHESVKKCNKNKQNKQPGYKEKMYPDIEEIDMFEDKFDKIKRKRRSQAVAAKQVQVVAEISPSTKSRKQSERKKNKRSIKKNYQSTQVLTKGALKGFESIKISIPTQDLNMPINVSPQRHSKKRRKTITKRRKDTSDSDSSCGEFDEKDKSVLDRDIYEFKDSEDAELFDLRPSTVMDRFRSMHNKNKVKQKEKYKTKDKEKARSKEKERKTDVKDSKNFETVKSLDKYNTMNDSEKGQKKYFSRVERRGTEKDGQCTINYDKNLQESLDETLKGYGAPGKHREYNCKIEKDSAIAGTSGLARDRIEETDYESEMSSPEGDFIFYMSNDINCVCPSDNDSDDSDVEKGCGRLNCVNKNVNADKNAAIENIFKNNAVRCEKPDLVKEPEKPRPNLDQLFDSLLETESKPSKYTSENQNDVTITSKVALQREISAPLSLVAQHNLTVPKDDHHTSLNKDIITIFDESNSKATSYQPGINSFKSDENTQGKSVYTSSLCQNDILTDSGSMQMFTTDDKSKENLGYSLMSEESTQVNFSDIIAQSSASKDETNDKHLANVKATKTGVTYELEKYNSEDEFDIDKPETLNRHYMHLILPAEKTSSCVQTENSIDIFNEESGNESAASKYLKGLSPSEAANMEIYTMVSAQSTQTDKTKRDEGGSSKYDSFLQSKSEGEPDMRVVPKSRIRLQKYDVREIAHKSKSTKSIQTDKNKGYTSSHYNDLEKNDDDIAKTDICKRADKETGLVKSYKVSNSVFQQDTDAMLAEDHDAFAAPALKSTAEKNCKKSPKKSDEGISTSHDYSADSFDQQFDNTGVACQRARRKCTVGKQNVLAEHWSSESEFDGAPPRPNSADSVVATAPRKKRSRKKEGHQSSGKKGRHISKSEKASRARAASGGGRSEEDEPSAGGRPPPGPKMRARAAHHYWSSEGEETVGSQPQHGWIVGDSHKKLVTMLAHAKGRKRNNADKHLN